MTRRPNKKQKRWVEDFCKKYNAHVVQTYDATCGYFYFTLRWREYLPIFAPSHTDDEEIDLGCGWQTKQLYVELTPAAVDRFREEKIVETIYPHCDLEYSSTKNIAIAQSILPLPQMLEIKKPIVAKPKSSPRQKTKKIHSQHELPIDPLGQEILNIRLSQGDVVRSRQELLAQKVAHYSLSQRRVVQLNQALIDLLLEIGATNDEWESAVDLLGVIGELGALHYIKSIPEWRKLKGVDILLRVENKVRLRKKSSQPQKQSWK